MAAPDYVAPIVGWRGWLVVSVEEGLRLCSPLYPTIWPPRRATLATCRAREGWAPAAPAEHPAPEESCRCGIYASESPATAASFISGPSLSGREPRDQQPVLGRVSLWGRVVECERGWRAARAYPALLYVPALLGGAHTAGPPPERPLLPAEVITRALDAYGVPVELIACETLRQAAEMLADR